MKHFFQKGKFFDDYVQEVMFEVYEEKTKAGKKCITKQDYAKAIVSKYKNKGCTAEDEKKLVEAIRPSVSRAIDRLTISGIMTKSPEGKKTYYYPAGIATRDQLVNKIDYLRRDIDILADSFCVLFVDNDQHVTASHLLNAYLGEICYTITQYDNALLVGVKYRDDTCDDPFEYDHHREKDVIRELAKIVRESYDLKHPKELNNTTTQTTETKE